MRRKKKVYVDRETSWLSFNYRVLQEAADPTVPLLERLKFLGIYSSNMDEFFSVRVGTLKRLIEAGIKSSPYYFDKTPKKVLKEVQKIVMGQRKEFEKLFNEIKDKLEKENIYIINEKNLNYKHKRYLKKYFTNKVRPRLIPIMLKTVKKFPYIKHLAVYLAITLESTQEPEKKDYALIEVPADVLPRFIRLPSIGENKYIIMLDDIIRFGLEDIFTILNYDKFNAYTIKLTRDAEIDISDEVTTSFFEKMSESLEQRKHGDAVRIVYDEEIPDDFFNYILKEMKLTKFKNLIPGGRYHNARDFIKFPKIGPTKFRYEKISPLIHEQIKLKKSLFSQIKKNDILLHFPYHSFHYVIDLLREAAIDPNVHEIKMTLYRVADKSDVVNALINAIRNGKKVTVLLELQARFDEESNIYWTQKLEKIGANIITGIPGIKIHSKLCLIVRKESNKLKYYSILGTGNFNESTARLYADHALFTCNQKITKEVNKLFDFLEHNYKSFNYKHIVLSPNKLRKKINELINNEIKNAKKGKKAEIRIKINNLVDKRITNKLYRASQEGVKIKMIVRSNCSIVPQIKHLSENIEVYSIVDKFLEHSRIYIFHNNGNRLFFISSADWMVRNLDKRIEVTAPIYDKYIQKELWDYVDIQLKDNSKARIIDKKHTNKYRENKKSTYRAQVEIYDYLKNKR